MAVLCIQTVLEIQAVLRIDLNIKQLRLFYSIPNVGLEFLTSDLNSIN